MKSPYERPARPWDLFNKNLGRVELKIAEERMAICNECEHLIQATKTCKECGCFMTAKTKLPNAACPIQKWGQVQVSYKEEQDDTTTTATSN